MKTELISRGRGVFNDYVSELFQKRDGSYGVWIIPTNREPSDSEVARYETLTLEDVHFWLECHKRNPA